MSWLLDPPFVGTDTNRIVPQGPHSYRRQRLPHDQVLQVSLRRS